MEISVVGAGHVGLVTGACFADLGHSVVMVDNDAARIANLKKGVMPYYEPGLEELVDRGVREQRLSCTTSIKEGGAKFSIVDFAYKVRENGVLLRHDKYEEDHPLGWFVGTDVYLGQHEDVILNVETGYVDGADFAVSLAYLF